MSSIPDLNLTLALYNNANNICQFSNVWNADIEDFKKSVKKTYNDLLVLTAKYPYLKNHVEVVKTKYDQLDFILNHDQRETSTCCVFVWDTVTPFFANGTDVINPKFKKMKHDLNILNDETCKLEDNRSRKLRFAENANSGTFPEVKADLRFEKGQAILIDRPKQSKLGFIIDKYLPYEPIEVNRYRQARMENTMSNDSPYKQQLKDNEFGEYKNDTSESRRLHLNLAFQELYNKIIAHNIENPKKLITTLLFFANPLLPNTENYCQNLLVNLEYLCKSVCVRLHNNKNAKLIPYMKIFLLESGCYVDDTFYIPSIDSLKRASALVSNF